MADSVVKLRIDSQEYDANIKKAGQALTDYFNKVREGGGTLMHLDDGVLEAVQAMGQLGTMSGNTKGALRELTVATTDMTAAYRALTDEEKASPLGAAMAKSIAEMTERAGNMKDAMADVSAAITNAASDTRGFDQLAQGASLVTSGFQTMQGAAKLLGVEMGDNVEVLAKLQAAMAVTNGLTQIQTALQKQSALMQGVMAVQAKAAAVAQALLTTETKAGTIAQTAFNAVAKANPYVLLASAVAAVGLALVGFSKNAKQATDATNTETDAMKQAARMADIWKNTMQGTFSSLMTKYDALKRQWESLRTEHEKTEWIKKNQTALHDLGGAVNDVKSAEDFFNNNTDAVVQSFVRRAQAAARVAQLTELYRKQIELLDKKSQTSAAISEDAQKMGRSAKAGDEITDATFRSSRYGQVNAQGKWVFSEQGAKLYSGTDTSSAQSVMKIDVELQANQAEIDKVKSQITNEFSDVTVTPSGGGRNVGKNTPATPEVFPAGSMKHLQQEMQGLQEAQSLVTTTEEWRQYQQQIEDVQKQIRTLRGETEKLPEVFNGTSITTGKGMQKYISVLQQQLSETDFGSPIYNSIQQTLTDMNTLQTLVGESLKAGLGTAMFDVADELGADFWTRAMEGGVENIDWQPIIDKINEARKKAGLDAITIDFNTGKLSSDGNKKEKSEFSETTKTVSQITSSVGSIASGIQQLGVELPKGLQDVLSGIQGVTTILTGISSLIAIITALTEVKSVPVIGEFLANGGVVGKAAAGMLIPGTSYSGDNLRMPIIGGRGMIGVNSGELILNESSQDNLAASIRAAESLVGMIGAESSYLNRSEQGLMADSIPQDTGGTPMQPYVSGEMVFLAMNNYLRRSGKGEIVVSRR